MKKIKVLSYKNIPARLPVTFTLLAILCMDYWHASQLVYGMVIIMLIYLWINAIVRLSFVEETIDVAEMVNETHEVVDRVEKLLNNLKR